VLFERLVPRPALRWAASSALVATGLLIAPAAIPVLPPETLIRYQAALGVTPSRDERKAYNPLAQHLADQFGWPELVDTVEQAARSLPETERADAVVFAQNYGEAAALELLGEGRVPPVLSGHNNYFLWSRERLSQGPLLVLGPHEERLRELCSEVSLVATTPDQPHAMPYENRLPIYLCRGLRLRPEELWPRVRHFE
ncbi:MAG TPA: hypothetical protein VK420_19870, partial [Longimicrobium sp.]|nr:hypothetical protein [Longimicrobium sp.]